MLNHGPNQTLGCRPSLRHLPDVNACKSFGRSHERVPVQNGPSSKKPSEMGCRGALASTGRGEQWITRQV